MTFPVVAFISVKTTILVICLLDLTLNCCRLPKHSPMSEGIQGNEIALCDFYISSLVREMQ